MIILFYIYKIMDLISFDASPNQVRKLRNGHRVRIKKGKGFNLVVNPSNYNTITRAFQKNKGVEVNLSHEEIDENKNISPELQQEYNETMTGGSIFGKMKKGLNSKAGKNARRVLKPAGRAFLDAGKDMAYDQLAQAHMQGADYIGDNANAQMGLNLLANSGYDAIYNTGRSQGGALFKQLGSKKMKSIRRALKPAGRAFMAAGQDMAHDQLAQLHMQGANYVGDNPNAQMGYNMLANAGHDAIGYNKNPYYGMNGYGLGAGANAHNALRMATLANAEHNYKIAQNHNRSVHGQHTQPLIKRYYDEENSPISRGTGLHNNLNLISGRGTMSNVHDSIPALQSQPYGANFHMQFMLPPQYQRFNNGGDLVGRGLYI